MGCVKLSKPWVRVHQGHITHFIVRLHATEKIIWVQNLDKEDVGFIFSSTTQTFNFIFSLKCFSSHLVLFFLSFPFVPPLVPFPLLSSLPFTTTQYVLCVLTCPFPCLHTFSLSLLLILSLSLILTLFCWTSLFWPLPVPLTHLLSLSFFPSQYCLGSSDSWVLVFC